MKIIHAFILMRLIGERAGRLLGQLAYVRKPRAEKKAGRKNILSVNGHLRRDAGLDNIEDDP
ncbi:hypothetical protein CCGE525_13490 [Rhizobium jaguaris]|uniref:Uncharacterized protein n=1 Tax=Rhizobium jaguaris TaxID=1312183 RepID=A0A387FV30_9HYPH|nr:hypothetical protein CCGE525_13490 [Rhizobium jaguaris]